MTAPEGPAATDGAATAAAMAAIEVPGVVALHPGLTRTVARAAARLGRSGGARPADPTAGVRVTPGPAGLAVEVDVVARLGEALGALGRAVQVGVAAAVEEATGRPAVVTVNLVEVVPPGAS